MDTFRPFVAQTFAALRSAVSRGWSSTSGVTGVVSRGRGLPPLVSPARAGLVLRRGHPALPPAHHTHTAGIQCLWREAHRADRWGKLLLHRHLCSLLRFHGLARFVGEESGGGWSCTDASRDTVLPHSGLRLRSSTLQFRAAVSGMERGRGIVPDMGVSATIDDLIAGRDPVLDAAFRWLSEP